MSILKVPAERGIGEFCHSTAYFPAFLLLSLLELTSQSHPGFIALGGVAMAVCHYSGFNGFMSCLPALQALIREAITSKRQRCPEALRCTGTLAAAVRNRDRN